MLKKAGIDHLKRNLGKKSRIIMRADYNVPIGNGEIADATRIEATLPTIEELLAMQPKSLVILSHMGRPNGQKKDQLSLRKVADQLSGYLNRKVTFLPDCIGTQTLSAVNQADNQVFLCENVRFHAQEQGSIKDSNGNKIAVPKEDIIKFRNQLQKLGECFVNDGFGTAHRAHSSVVGINHRFRVAGRLLEKEIHFLGKFIEQPEKPTVVILGGSKVADKISLIKNLLNIADEIIIGGGMKIPFLTGIFGRKLGSSKVPMPQDISILHSIVSLAETKGCKLHFPIDYRAGKDLRQGTQVRVFSYHDEIPQGWKVFDMGPQSQAQMEQVISKANTIFWNGPLGVIEVDEFREGSISVLTSIISRTQKGAKSIVGGGDSAALLSELGLKDEITYTSTGGGATLNLLEGKTLPGIQALSDSRQLI